MLVKMFGVIPVIFSKLNILFFDKKIKKKKLNLNLFGNITIEYDKDYEELTDKPISCLLLLEKGYERFSDKQRKVFSSVNQMTILKENEPKKMQGSASQQTKRIHFNPEWLLKHKTGGGIMVNLP